MEYFFERPKLNSQSSFTVIELLVTIAVIGLLASIVLVALDLPGKRRQATLAKALEFSQSTQNAIGDEMVGSWTFENVTGNKTPDMSGNGNEGTISGAIPADGLKLASGVGTGKALQFDGVDDYVEIANDDIFHIPDAITVEAWLKAATVPQSSWANIVNRRVVKNASPYNAWIICIGPAGNTIEFFITNPAGEGPVYGQWRVLGGALTTNWTHVAGTYDGTTQRIYVNGQLIESNNVSITLNISDGPIIFASTTTESQYFNGLIDNIRIYSRALTIGEIQKHYAAGLAGHREMAAR